jgi:hypothetical protein
MFQGADLLNSFQLWQGLGGITLGKQAVNSGYVCLFVEIDLTDLTVCEKQTSVIE